MLKIIGIFILVCIAWIPFRANTIADTFIIINKIFSEPGHLFFNVNSLAYGGLSLLILLIKDFLDEYLPTKIQLLDNKRVYVRYISYIFLICFIILFGVFDGGQFIYFQF